MEGKKTTLEKAFELARSGKYLTVDEIIYRLKFEGYGAQQIEGKALKKQLLQLIKESRRTP